MDNPVVSADCKDTNRQIPLSTSLALNDHTFLGVNPYKALDKRHLALHGLVLAMFLDDEVEVRVEEGSPGIDLFEKDKLAEHKLIIIIQTNVWHCTCKGSK